MLNTKDYQNFYQLLTAAVAQKEKIYVQLINGTRYHGEAARYGDGFLVIQSLQGQEYYDALIPESAICAVEVKAR